MSKIKNRIRVILGPQEISGYYKNLELGFRELGIPIRFVSSHPHPFEYGQATPNPLLAKLASFAVTKHRSAGIIASYYWACVYLLSSFLLVFWTLPRFDVYVFAWGTSFLPLNLDIPIYRLFGKKVFVVLGHGSEARPPYMSTPPYSGYPETKQEINKLEKSVKRVARTVRRNERFANQVIGMQMTAQFLTKPFVDFYRIGLPSPAPADKEFLIHQDNFSDKIEILHVPSNKAVKGTIEIRSAMDAILKSNENVQYRELSGVAHDEILLAMSKTDIVLDWLWSDIPMAVVGAEAASLSKPTIISSYGWPQWERWEKIHGEGLLPPVIRATPETLQQVIENAVNNLSNCQSIGTAANRFISEIWTPSKVASNFLRVLTGEVPDSWILSPQQVDYLWGAGVSKENTLCMVQALISNGKPNSLHWAAGEAMYREYLARSQSNEGSN